MALTLGRLIGRTGPPLRHDRVLLVEPERRHYEAWSLLRETSRQHLEPFEPTWGEDELSLPAFRRRIRRYRSDRMHGCAAAFFIERVADGVLVGGVTLTNIRRGVTQSASLGYWIGLPYVRQGYASDAVAAIVRYAFDELGLNRIEAASMPRNRASLGVLEKAGFEREGLARGYLKINGAFEDHVLLARLSSDVPGLRGRREQSQTSPALASAGPAPLDRSRDPQAPPGKTKKASAAEGHAA